MAKKFYVATTIPYANGPAHLGFALEVVEADVLARWNRIQGKDVFFLTGTDEHGTKNYQTAKKQGLSTKEFVDKNSKSFQDLIDGKCPDHPKLEIETIEEENYFFKLSKYSDKILKLVKEDKLKIYPEHWKNDFLSLTKDGLQDVSFSRNKKQLPWGIPVPNDPEQVMYVWCDALTNYLTGIGYPDKKYEKYWPTDLHVVGKDMLRFHAGIWPGMLLSADLPLPKEIIVHGFLTVDGKKMSKSTGNVISPLELLKKYSPDTIRYYLCRNFVFGQDGDFSEKALIDRHNSELADKLGNLVSRVAGLIEKNGIEKTENKLIRQLYEIAQEFVKKYNPQKLSIEEYKEAYQNGKLSWMNL